jgi:hypothetical protein
MIDLRFDEMAIRSNAQSYWKPLRLSNEAGGSLPPGTGLRLSREKCLKIVSRLCCILPHFIIE